MYSTVQDNFEQKRAPLLRHEVQVATELNPGIEKSV
jgi:hypothetical protein